MPPNIWQEISQIFLSIHQYTLFYVNEKKGIREKTGAICWEEIEQDIITWMTEEIYDHKIIIIITTIIIIIIIIILHNLMLIHFYIIFLIMWGRNNV
jgi:hypothetical protein